MTYLIAAIIVWCIWLTLAVYGLRARLKTLAMLVNEGTRFNAATNANLKALAVAVKTLVDEK